MTIYRQYDESSKKITYIKEKNPVCHVETGYHYFHIGEARCLCGKYDGKFDPTKKK